MVRRHRAIPFCLLLILALPCSIPGLSITADWTLGVRLGEETELCDWARFKVDIGASLFGLVVADALLVLPLIEPKQFWNVDLLIGIPNAATPVTFPGGMFSIGASVRIGCRMPSKHRLSLRIGAGYPFFLEPGRPVIRDTNLPVDFWPDLALEYRLAPR